MRLIDADKYKHGLNCAVSGTMHDERSQQILKAMLMVLDMQPTAYDPGKVVQQLDKASDYYEFDEQGMEHVQMLRLVDAIEIVKGCGVDAQANP